jgi:hypothetical protein
VNHQVSAGQKPGMPAVPFVNDGPYGGIMRIITKKGGGEWLVIGAVCHRGFTDFQAVAEGNGGVI